MCTVEDITTDQKIDSLNLKGFVYKPSFYFVLWFVMKKINFP